MNFASQENISNANVFFSAKDPRRKQRAAEECLSRVRLSIPNRSLNLFFLVLPLPVLLIIIIATIMIAFEFQSAKCIV